VSSVAQSWAEPDLTARVNGAAAVALLESALQAQDKHGRPVRFVQASSAEIFGEPATSPQTEDTPVRPVNPYGAAKAYAHLAVDVYRRRGLHAVSAILYNHESPRRPEQFVTRKITRGVAAIAHGRADHLTLGNLDARRDWGWAPDYVDAMVRAARADQPADYVVATGVGHTVRDFVAAAFTAAGIDDWEPLVRTDPALVRPADPADLVGDATRARTRLGWAPTVTFEELVRRMVAADLTTPSR
jgi:GDPmannose 4,6-dehydratase